MARFQTNEKELTSFGLKSFVPITGLNDLYLKYEKKNYNKHLYIICKNLHIEPVIYKERYFDSEVLSHFNVQQSAILQARHEYVRAWPIIHSLRYSVNQSSSASTV